MSIINNSNDNNCNATPSTEDHALASDVDKQFSSKDNALNNETLTAQAKSVEQPIYYQAPANHDSHFKAMKIWLVSFFSFLVVLVTLIVIFADTLARQLPFSAEQQFVQPYEELAARYFTDEENEQEIIIENYLNNLGSQLTTAMDLPDDISVKIHYLDTDTVNAFATLGGHIFVCRGLIEQMPDENSLAMVLGHEIAHVKNRDPLVGITRGLALQMLYSFATGDYGNIDVAGYGSEIGMLYFSRDQERQADQDAVYALNTHYGHVLGYDTVFRIFEESEEEEDKEAPAWLSSHPKLQERIDLLNDTNQKNQWIIKNPTPIDPAVTEAIEILSE